MKRFSFIIAGSLVAALLIGAVWFLLPADQAALEISEISPEEESGERESVAAILGTVPTQPDFGSITETIFLNEGVAEAKSYEKMVLAPLQALGKKGEELRHLLEKEAANWCAPLAGFVEASAESGTPVTDEGYRASLQEEREIRDATLLAQAFQAGDEWGWWLLRLTEAIEEESKGKQKSVEAFQERFNAITDAYEETLSRASGESREKIDRIIFAEKESALTGQKLFGELERSLGTELQMCRAGQSLEEGRYQAALNRVVAWEKRAGSAFEAHKKVQNQILDVPTDLIAHLSEETRQYTKKLEEALTALQVALQE